MVKVFGLAVKMSYFSDLMDVCGPGNQYDYFHVEALQDEDSPQSSQINNQ